MKTLVTQLRAAHKKLSQAEFSRDRAVAISEALPVIEKVITALVRLAETPSAPSLDADVVVLLASLGKGTKVLGREYYVNDTDQFDRAARRLFERYAIHSKVTL